MRRACSSRRLRHVRVGYVMMLEAAAAGSRFGFGLEGPSLALGGPGGLSRGRPPDSLNFVF